MTCDINMYCTYLVCCMLSCYCHWCRCRYYSSWCYSPCDWHMYLASCLAATVGSEVHSCREERVCNKVDQRTVNQNSLLNEQGSVDCSVKQGHISPLWFSCATASSSPSYNSKEYKYRSPASIAHRLSPLIRNCRGKQEKKEKKLNLDELSNRQESQK